MDSLQKIKQKVKQSKENNDKQKIKYVSIINRKKRANVLKKYVEIIHNENFDINKLKSKVKHLLDGKNILDEKYDLTDMTEILNILDIYDSIKHIVNEYELLI